MSRLERTVSTDEEMAEGDSSHGYSKELAGWISSIGSRDGTKVKSVPHEPRQTADVVVVRHGALRCVSGVATIDTRVLLVAEVFVVAVV